MTDVKGILDKMAKLKAANKKGKIDLLPGFMEDPEFKKFMLYTMDTRKVFNVSSVKPHPEPLVGEFYPLLDQLTTQKAAKKAQKEELARIASQSPEHFEVINLILKGKPGANIGAKFMHEIMPGTIPYFPYQRCSTHEVLPQIFEGNEYAFSDKKEDGLYLDIICDVGGVTFRTRNGKDLDFDGGLDSLFNLPQEVLLDNHPHLFKNGMVFQGEGLVLDDDGVPLPRKDGNAIINKFQDGHGTQAEMNRIVFSIWNVLPAECFHDGFCDLTVEQRREMVALACEVGGGVRVYQTETRKVYSQEEAWDHYHEVRSRPVPEGYPKLEGTIVKDPNETWTDGTSRFMGKLKAEREIEVLCTGWEYGKATGRHKDVIGSLHFESACGQLKGKCSGLSDAERAADPDTFVGQVISVIFNAVSNSKAKETRSLDHARYNGIRTDKSEADDLAYILKVKSCRDIQPGRRF